MFVPTGRTCKREWPKAPDDLDAQEVEAEEPEAKHGKTEEYSKAATKRHDARLKRDLADAVGEYKPEFTQALVVTVPDSYYEAEATHDQEEAIDVIPGIYWAVGKDGADITIFRQAPLDAESDGTAIHQLWMYYSGGMWYIADSLVGNHEQKIFARLDTCIGDVVVPHWAKDGEGLADIRSTSLHTYIQDQYEDRLTPYLQRDAASKANEEKMAEKGGGGWFNRLESVMNAYEAGNWSLVQSIIDDARSSTLYKAVMKRRCEGKPSSGKSSGKKGKGKDKSKGKGKGKGWQDNAGGKSTSSGY